MNLYALTTQLLKTRNNKYSRPVIQLTIAGVALGLIIMLLAVMITSGYKKEIREKIVGIGSHIRISNYDQNYSYDPIPFHRDQFFIKDLQANPQIKNIQFYSTKVGILKTTDQVEGVVLKGIDSTFAWSNFEKCLLEEVPNPFKTNQMSNDIFISKKISKKLKLRIGDKVAAYFVQEPPKQRNFTVRGIYETGLPDYDEKFVLVDLRHVQKLNGWDSSQVGGIELLIDDYAKMDELGEKVNLSIGYKLKAETIKQIYPNIFEWLLLFDTNVIVLLVITIFVCIITMISTFFIIVLEQIKTIGILKTIGMETKSVFRLFLLMGTRLIVRGLIWGNAIAILIFVIQKNFKWIKLDPETYYVSFVPVAFNTLMILAVNVGVLVLCMAALAIPALIVSKKISPINAIRFD
ncbi:MAG: ABC transporter permease [Bacteroidales bacterium]|jgi:lipoprotein-releasing system permease protein|nr:ABC transporter permease [Bacteroidales bacterium]